jgi:hypothetical protein
MVRGVRPGLTAADRQVYADLLDRWDSAVVEGARRRARRPRDGLEICAASLDVDAVRLLDTALAEIVAGSSGRECPSSRLDLATMRSAAVEVVLSANLAVLRARRLSQVAGPANPYLRLSSSITGDTVSVAPGLLRRLSLAGRQNLETCEFLLPPRLVRDVNSQLGAVLDPDDLEVLDELWGPDGFVEYRSAFVEAGMVSWLGLRVEMLREGARRGPRARGLGMRLEGFPLRQSRRR